MISPCIREHVIKSLLLTIFIVILSQSVNSTGYEIHKTCYTYTCINAPLFIWVANESLLNGTDTSQIQILQNGAVNVPFQWYNATNRDIAMFLVNATDNTTINYTLRTDSGSTHNVSTLFPKDNNASNGLDSNVRAHVYPRAVLDDYSCSFGNCWEFTWSNEQDLFGGGSIKAVCTGGDDAIQVAFTNSLNYFQIWFYDNMDADAYYWVVIDDTGAGGEIYPCGVRTATSAANYAYYDGTTYIDSGIPRSTGWHKCAFRANGATTTSYIDGQLALNADADVANIDVVKMYTETAASTTYYDMLLNSPIDIMWGGQLVEQQPMNYTLTALAGAAGSTDIAITATDEFNGSSINSFSTYVTWSNNGSTTTHSTTNGTIALNNVSENDLTINITYFGMSNYFNRTIINEAITANTSNTVSYGQHSFFRIYRIDYSNYTSYSGTNYTRNLNYSINISCPSFSTTNFSILISGVYLNLTNVACTNNSQNVTGNITGQSEGSREISFYFNTSVNPTVNNIFYGNQTFTWDLNSPYATGNFTRANGFNNFTTNVSSRCYDNIYPVLNHTSTFNSVVYFNSNTSNNTARSNSSTLIWGENTLNVTCRDPWSTSIFLDSDIIYATTLYLIDERDNTAFNLANITGARAYFDDNSSYFDFKVNNTNQTTFTGVGNEKLRFELVYASGDVVTRYIDVTLINTSAIRVCANKEGVTHYEQLIISATIRPVVLKSIFSDCLVAADYTRFAYQDTYLLKAYTISSLYYLYTWDNDVQILLASVDGTISTYMNLDTLEFAQTSYELSAYGQGLGIEKVTNTEVRIVYQDIQSNNINASISISDISTGINYLSTTATNPNNFTIYFDWTTLSYTNQTLFEVIITTTDSDGNVNTIKQYINTLANTGKLSAAIGFVIAILLTVFGLTMTATRYALGWFGMAILIGAIAVLSLSVLEWYVLLLMVIDVILLIFVIIIFITQNYHTAVS